MRSLQILNYDYYPRKSHHAHHGAACFQNGMMEGFQCLGRRALASVPHHKQATCARKILMVMVCTRKYKYNLYCALLVTFFCVLYLSYVAVLRKTLTPPLMHNRPKKLANHGVQRLLPIALPMGWRCPNPAHRPHPHTIG